MSQQQDGTRRVLFSGRYVRLMDDESWEYAERVGASGVVAIVPLHEDRIILTEQFRRAVSANVIDLPAGLAGDAGSSPAERLETAARRELFEETGYKAATLKQLAVCPSSPGLTSEMVTIFLGTDLESVHGGGGDDSEQITVHAVPLDTIDTWLEAKSKAGILIDPKVYAGLYFASRR